ncbi:MAG: SpoIID/LytB domain-containing protein [Candidatus Omnitrophota bacterium]
MSGPLRSGGRKKILLISGSFFLTLVVFFYIRPSSKQTFPEDSSIIRVRIARHAVSADIHSSGICRIIDPLSGKVILAEADIRKDSEIKISGGKILAAGKVFKERVIRISPGKRSGFYFNGTEYRGELDITLKGQHFYAVNRVGLEDYLKGVIPREVYNFWPMSVLKAQAVASRSYALFESRRRKKREYDLTSDTLTQVYGGRSAERARTTNAVVSTRGEVLNAGGELIPGYFHASCGGHTADISKVWGGVWSEHFKGKRSPYCRWTPPYRWRARIPTTEILSKLNSSGHEFDRIDDIRSGKRDASGRVEYVMVRSRNRWFEIPARDILNSIGRKTLKSSNFRVKKYPLFYDFNGYGWGHGVGMCQWCAFGLSLRRWDYKRILEFFYPGAKVSPLEED